jgi:hypothetical protein
MRNLIAISFIAASLAACATTTKGDEVRNDHSNVEKQRAQLHAAERDGSIKDVRNESKDLRKAQRELRSDQKELYRPGVNASPADGLQVGQVEPGGLQAVPAEYRSQYRDGDGSYYRFDGLRIYQINALNQTVMRVYPVNG